jgi:hypothetical protein
VLIGAVVAVLLGLGGMPVVAVLGGVVGVGVWGIGVGVPPPEALKAANASTLPYPKLLFGIWLLGIPPHVCTGLKFTLGFAVCSNNSFVPVMSLTNAGRADHISATTPATCGPAIDVPLAVPYAVSLVLVADLTFTPGADISGFSRFGV